MARGQDLWKIRKQAGMSQQALATALGLKSRQTVADLERGAVPISPAVLKAARDAVAAATAPGSTARSDASCVGEGGPQQDGVG